MNIPATAVGCACFLALLAVVFLPCRASLRLRELLFIEGTATNGRMALFDLVRGFAAMHVVLFHLWYWNTPYSDPVAAWSPLVGRGVKAVPIFASLSGYLIYSIALKLRTTGDIPGYFKRRFLRIYPLYLATTIGYMFALNPKLTGSAQSWISGVLMLRCAGSPELIGPTSWSIYVEEVFYLVAPMLAGLLRGCGAGARIHAMLGALLVSVFFMPWQSQETSLIPFFIAGAIAYELSTRPRTPRLAIAALAAGTCLLYTDLFSSPAVHTLFVQAQRALGMTKYPLASLDLLMGLVLVLYSGSDGTVDRLFRCRPVFFFGSISYSLYLVQGFVLMDGFRPASIAVFAAAKIAAVIGISVVTFLLIERPFLRYRTDKPGAA